MWQRIVLNAVIYKAVSKAFYEIPKLLTTHSTVLNKNQIEFIQDYYQCFEWDSDKDFIDFIKSVIKTAPSSKEILRVAKDVRSE